MTQPFGSSSLYPQMPQVPWLYVHEIILRRIDTAAGTVDAEGRWLAGQSRSEQPCMAFVSGVGPERSVSDGEARQEKVDAVARVPRDTEVRYVDEVEIRGVSWDLDGVYRISQTRINPVDVRLMLVRIADDDTFIGEPTVVSGEIGLHGQSGP